MPAKRTQSHEWRLPGLVAAQPSAARSRLDHRRANPPAAIVSRAALRASKGQGRSPARVVPAAGREAGPVARDLALHEQRTNAADDRNSPNILVVAHPAAMLARQPLRARIAPSAAIRRHRRAARADREDRKGRKAAVAATGGHLPRGEGRGAKATLALPSPVHG